MRTSSAQSPAAVERLDRRSCTRDLCRTDCGLCRRL